MPLSPRLSRALGCATLLSASVVGAALADPADPERTPATGPVIDQKRLPSVSAPAAPEKAALQPPSDRRGPALAEAALQLVGQPYRWGGASPATGFDCSGLAVFVYGTLGFDLPRTAAEQGRSGRQVERDALATGDLLVFRDTYRAGPSHSAIYLGDGRFVHANDERTGVVISKLADRYWATRLHVARRLVA